MSALVILIGVSIVVAVIFLIAFIWSVKNGQYDDTVSPSVRMLFEKKKKNTAKKGSIGDTRTDH